MSGGSSSSNPKDFTPSAFKNLRSGVAHQLQMGAGTEAFNPQLGQNYGANLVAGPTQQQYADINQIQGFANPDNVRQQEQMLRGIAGGSQLDLRNDPVFNNNLDYLQRRFLSAFDQPEEANKALFARAGQQLPSSSAFAREQTKLSELKAQGLSDLYAQQATAATESGRNRQLQAVSQLDALEKGKLERAQAALEAQDLPRLIRDLGLERAREEFTKRQQAIRDQLALAGQLSSPTVANKQSSTNFGLL